MPNQQVLQKQDKGNYVTQKIKWLEERIAKQELKIQRQAEHIANIEKARVMPDEVIKLKQEIANRDTALAVANEQIKTWRIKAEGANTEGLVASLEASQKEVKMLREARLSHLAQRKAGVALAQRCQKFVQTLEGLSEDEEAKQLLMDLGHYITKNFKYTELRGVA